jgi:hypothetical protein
MENIQEKINEISRNIENTKQKRNIAVQDVKEKEQELINSIAYKELEESNQNLANIERKIKKLESMRESLITNLMLNCEHKLLFDYGYSKKVGARFHTGSSKETADYRGLQCICCEVSIHAKQDDDLYLREENIIPKDNLNFKQLHNLYISTYLDKDEDEAIKIIKKSIM